RHVLQAQGERGLDVDKERGDASAEMNHLVDHRCGDIGGCRDQQSPSPSVEGMAVDDDGEHAFGQWRDGSARAHWRFHDLDGHGLKSYITELHPKYSTRCKNWI